jgi:pSer/pThr/pTyr-binding forkhead associated (FHA) protein
VGPGDRIGLGIYVAIFDEEARPERIRGGRNGASAGPGTQASKPPRGLGSELGLESDIESMAYTDPENEPGKRPRTVTTKLDALPKKPTLVLLYNGLEVSRHELYSRRPMVVGRSKKCDVEIGLLGLSRRHAEIKPIGDGAYEVVDLGSQNGTWVNNQRVEGTRVLHHGDLMNFYEYGLLFLEHPEEQIDQFGEAFAIDEETSQEQNLELKETGRRPMNPAGAPQSEKQRPPTPEAELGLDVEIKPLARKGGDLMDELDGLLDDEDRDPTMAKKSAEDLESSGLSDLDLSGDGEWPPGADLEGGTRTSATSSNPHGFSDSSLGVSEFEKAQSASDVFLNSEQLNLDGINTKGLADSEMINFEEDNTMASELDSLADASSSMSSSILSELPEPTRTNASARFPLHSADGADPWPTDPELLRGLQEMPQKGYPRLEIYLDDSPYTSVPLEQTVNRLGTDPRCEIALPTHSGLKPWHVTFVRFPAAVFVYRASKSAKVKLGGGKVLQAGLMPGDELDMGRVRVTFKW